LDAITNFLAMGGYAAFVWPAFGITAAVLVGLLLASLRDLKAREAELNSLPPLPGRGARLRDPKPAPNSAPTRAAP
jgi:heme exporter protein D